MRSYRLSAFVSLALAACFAVVMDVGRTLAAAPLAAYRLAERGVAFVFAWFTRADRDPALRLDLDGRQLAFEGYAPLDPALQNSMRHEAGMRPLRC